MSNLFDKLNLRPMERRLAVLVGFIVFLVLNVIFVWPLFGEWKVEREELKKNRVELAAARKEIANLGFYKTRLAALQGEGAVVIRGEQTTDLQKTVNDLAIASGVSITSFQNIPGLSDGTFFDEKAISVTSPECPKENLNKFLIAITASDRMIRIRDLRISRSRSQQNLDATVTVVASYQRDLSQQPKTDVKKTGQPGK